MLHTRVSMYTTMHASSHAATRAPPQRTVFIQHIERLAQKQQQSNCRQPIGHRLESRHSGMTLLQC